MTSLIATKMVAMMKVAGRPASKRNINYILRNTFGRKRSWSGALP